ncbi:MAG: cytochrome c3 family protein [Deltaproteobacteria bacterium]|nr:cytochrome c3 family protein [Deltaproteobacteria bacterium]MBW2601389.1 cytochrome c3 family protein [Deltaproteobacteria bacterium]
MKDVAVAFSIGVLVLVSVLAFVPAHSQEDMAVLQDSAYENRQRPAAVFVHEQHNEKAELDECSVCHHVYEDGKKVDDESSEDKRCSDCHKVKSGYQARPLMKAYHDLCKSCHQESRVGPITCGECHTPG